MNFTERMLTDKVIKAFRDRGFVSQEWNTRDFPEAVARIALDAVPQSYRKTKEGWSHPKFGPMTQEENRRLGEWLTWEEKFPFMPRRKWAKLAKRTAEGFVSFTPNRQYIHNRFLRVRKHGDPIFNEWFNLSFRIGGRMPELRFAIGSIEVAFAPIPKNQWRTK